MMVSGITIRSNAGVATRKPSTAASTEMAGVITPSPYSSAAPKMPSMIRMERFLASAPGRTSASRARIPPSPRLSARSTSAMYLKETTKLSDQNTSDSTPRTFSGVSGTACFPLKHSLRAYSGDVPMSP